LNLSVELTVCLSSGQRSIGRIIKSLFVRVRACVRVASAINHSIAIYPISTWLGPLASKKWKRSRLPSPERGKDVTAHAWW